MAPASPADGQLGSTFQPINPDGSLVDCVPPPCLSPTGPIAYLQQTADLDRAVQLRRPGRDKRHLRRLRRADAGHGAGQRRGPVGTLTASCANLDTPLPLIDLVNECLEYLAAAAPATTARSTTPPQ